MRALPDRLLEHIRSASLFPEPGTAVLAVSGGPDSLCLLDLLHGLAGALGLRLVVAHVDHGILPESAAVAARVGAVAGRYGVPAEIERARLGPGASETRARRARYAALRRVQQRVAARYLVTAHQADDQIETVLYRLLRGSGVSGLAAIRPVGPGGLVRPLLPFRRAELDQWLLTRFPDAESRPPVFHDPSNADERHDRSWLRGRVLPLLVERFGARLERQLLGLARHAARERDAWSALLTALPELAYRRGDAAGVGHGVEVARAPLLGYEPPLAEAILRALGREAGCPLGPARSGRLLAFLRRAPSGRVAELGQGWVAEVSFGRVRIGAAGAAARTAPLEWGATGQEPDGRVVWGAWEVHWRAEAAGAASRQGWRTWVTPGRGVVRPLARGDRLVPLGGVGHRSASRLLMEARVPRSARASYPVVARGTEILWLPGVCRSAAQVPPAGEPALRLDVVSPGGVGGAATVR
jgi:tRNA(Ile)-lysidine synthase